MSDAPVIVIRKKRRGGGHGGAHGGAWKVAYADFVTAMMCFFMVMWLLGADEETKQAVSHYFNHPNTPYRDGRDPSSIVVNPLGEKPGSGESVLNGAEGDVPAELVDKPVKPIEQQRVSHQKLGERAQEMMEDQLYGIDASVDLLRFSIPEDLLFAPGSTELRPEAQKHLVRLGRILESYPGYVKIEGHTDGQESPGKPVGSEFEFALTRAVSVMKYLVAKNYLREDRVLPTSVGPRKPYTSDPSAEGRAKNRRIEFTLSSTRSF